MEEMDYRAGTDKRKIRQRYVLHGKRYHSADAYYGAVYEDIVHYKQIDSSKIKSDQDLKKFLEGDPKITDKLKDKLVKTPYHQELVSRNLGEKAYRLKNGRIVKTSRATVKGRDVIYYKDMLIIADKRREFYRDVRSGRFIRIR